MPTQFNGQPARIQNNLPTAKNIASTGSTSPTVVTTTAPHNCKTNDYVRIAGAATSGVNGDWLCTVLSATTLALRTIPGGANAGPFAAGGAAGTLLNLGFGSTMQLESDGDPDNAAGRNIAKEAAGDRTAYLLYRATQTDDEVALKANRAGDTFTGPVVFDGTNPPRISIPNPATSANPGANDPVYPVQVAKALGRLNVNAGSISVTKGFNVTGASVTLGTTGNVAFARPMADAGYLVVWGAERGSAGFVEYPITLSKTVNGFTFNIVDVLTGTTINLGSTSPGAVTFAVYGVST